MFDCSNPDALSSVDVASFLAAIQHSYSYSPMSLQEMNALREAVQALDSSQLLGAQTCASRAGYRLLPLLAGGACYWLLAPPGYPAAIEQALVLYAPDWRRDLVIEAPHAHEGHRNHAP